MTLWLIVELYLNFVVCLIEKYIESNSTYLLAVVIYSGRLFSRSQSFQLEPYRLLITALKPQSCGVYRIGNIRLIERRMYPGALLLDIFQVSVDTLGYDFVDLAVIQPRNQATRQPLSPAGFVRPGRLGDSGQAILDHLNRESHRVGKLGVQQQELRNRVGAQVRGVHLAVWFEGRAAFEQRYPVQVVIGINGIRTGPVELGIVSVQ